MEQQQAILGKLKKLLALAASDNENEAALAMERAEEMMKKHNISLTDVAMDGSGAYVESKEVAGLTKGAQKWEISLGANIAATFDGTAIIQRHGTGYGWRFTFVAGRTDLSVIVDLYERLRKTVRRMSDAYVADNRRFTDTHPKTLHNSYRIGVVRTVGERLKKFKQAATPDESLNACGVSSKELMIVKDKAVSQRVRKLFPNTVREGIRHAGVTSDAYNQGKVDGRNVNLNRSVGGSNRTGTAALTQ